MLEGEHMLTSCRFEVLSLGKADVLPPGKTEDITEELYSVTPFVPYVDQSI